MNNVVKIEKLDHQGRGISHINGKIVFVNNALTDEIVKIKIKKENKKIIEADVLEYVSQSDRRIKSDCPYFNKCGGCNLLHMSYEDELIFKENKIKEIMNKYANVDEIKIKNIIPNNPYNYRNKATFQVNKKVGYFNDRSYNIVPIDNCLIVNDKINEIFKLTKKINLNNINQIIIRASFNTDDTMIIFNCNGPIDENIANVFSSVSSIYKFENNKYTLISGKKYILEKINELNFIISPDSFFQVNTLGAKNILNKVLEYAGKTETSIMDLFCGTGFIGLFLASYSKDVIGIEINKYAIADANKNKEINNISNIEFICDDVSNIKNKFTGKIVVVDPPRSGLTKETIDYLNSLKLDKIIYVSCDPMSLARDLKLLNYDVEEITPVDMFSRTYHVECVCILKVR